MAVMKRELCGSECYSGGRAWYEERLLCERVVFGELVE